MCSSLENLDTQAEILNCDLEKVSNWAKKWKVTFNHIYTIPTEHVNIDILLNESYSRNEQNHISDSL